VPPFDWEEGFDVGLGHGSLGGVGFRETSLPVIVHVTDAESHDCTDYTTYDPGIDAHCPAETFAALAALGARIVAVTPFPSTDPSDVLDTLGMVVATGAVVPTCAFDGTGARLSGTCGADECCTGVGGAGVPPDPSGDCPLVFEIDPSGAGLDTSIVDGIDALTRFVSYDLTVEPRDDPSDLVDARCFVDAIAIIGWLGAPGACASSPIPTDTDADGDFDTLRNATPRTRMTLEVTAVNTDVNDVDEDGDTTELCATTGTYGLFLDITAEGGTVVSTRRVEVVVP
jgi:hypothetical protein